MHVYVRILHFVQCCERPRSDFEYELLFLFLYRLKAAFRYNQDVKKNISE